VAHEVVKRVGKRAYRYSVETYRDPDTRKVRSRWTYLGTVQPRGAEESGPLSIASVTRRAPAQTRERLVSAVERLLTDHGYGDLTAGMIASDAGLAHGTFYRYFKDKREAFVAAMERIREQIERERPTFDPPFGTRDQERDRVRALLDSSLAKPAQHPGLIRAYFELLESDAELQAARALRLSERVQALCAYLTRLGEAGTIVADAPESLAVALTGLVDATFRDAVLARRPVDAVTKDGVIRVFDRAIFGVEAASG
jgi:AcrR family transcriptional regulator